jgi:hypothetical protein
VASFIDQLRHQYDCVKRKTQDQQMQQHEKSSAGVAQDIGLAPEQHKGTSVA